MKKEPLSWNARSDTLLNQKEFWQTLENCLKKLPLKSADAISLCEIEQINSKEVCKVLGVSATNLWVLLHRARLQLRECLEINWFEE